MKKLSHLKPWARLGITKKQYRTAKPWKKAKMSQEKYEGIILNVPQELIDEHRREAEAGLLIGADIWERVGWGVGVAC